MNDSNEINEVAERFITIIDHVWMVMWNVYKNKKNTTLINKGLLCNGSFHVMNHSIM